MVGTLKDIGSYKRKKIKNIVIKVGETIIEPKNNLRLLGVWFGKNNRFTTHVQNRFKMANKAKFALLRLLKSRMIEPSIKTHVYKQFLRPIITFGSAVWLRPLAVSSAQIEKIRLFERKILRRFSNKYRRRGSFKYCRNSELYQHSNMPRIDKQLAKINIKFFEKIERSPEHSFLISNNDDSGLRNKNIDHLYRLHKCNQLFINEKLLLFNRAYSNPHQIVYNTDQ